jgi:hypothetical protein
MTKPLFADNWYGKLPGDEVRKEVQELYAGIDTVAQQLSSLQLTWDAITGKPTEFPPEAHTHPTSEITDLASYTGLDARYYTETETDTLLGGYLPLAGGTLTGNLNFDVTSARIVKADTGGFLGLSAGTDSNVGGANIGLWGETSSTPDTGRLRVDGTTALEWNAAGDVILAPQGTGTTAATRQDRTITAGNGLTGGGNLTTDRTLTLGTPSSITNATTNSVSSTSHTHNWEPPVAAGEIGSYMVAATNDLAVSTALAVGNTRAGSTLIRSSSTASSIGAGFAGSTDRTVLQVSLGEASLSLAGTWRLMSRLHRGSNSDYRPIGLWVRIS